MKPPKEYLKNLKHHTITEKMLSDCIYSINNRALNSRDLKDIDKYAWLLDDLQNIPEEDLEEYVRAIKAVKSWAVSLDQKVDGLMDKVG